SLPTKGRKLPAAPFAYPLEQVRIGERGEERPRSGGAAFVPHVNDRRGGGAEYECCTARLQFGGYVCYHAVSAGTVADLVVRAQIGQEAVPGNTCGVHGGTMGTPTKRRVGTCVPERLGECGRQRLGVGEVGVVAVVLPR